MAITADQVKKLAELSRIALTDVEVEKLKIEVDSILSYVDTVQKAELPKEGMTSPHLALENVMREDGTPDEPGVYTEKMLAQAPRRERDFIKVKKILG